jgi:phosphoribosylamine--glycine ligase
VALAAVRDMLAGNAFGEAGHRVVVEEFLEGEEASFIVMVDGTHALALATSQDHKARDDGDRGPNTGGMGAYSPAPVVTDSVHERVMHEIMLPTVRGLAADGIRYRGFLYAGLMIDSDDQPRVIEFNCRLGDPETQPILFRLRSDLLEICSSCFDGTLGARPLEWDPRATIGVVMASRGYPDAYDKGKPISGLDRATGPNVKVFHAGTRLDGNRVVTDGGRVLCVVGAGASVRAARDAAYAGVREVTWDGAFCRTDIGYRALQREESGKPR